MHFTLTSDAVGAGEIFFTTDSGTTLPEGSRVELPVTHDSKPHDVSIVLDTDKQLRKLRIDVSDGPGTATIKNLRLVGGKANELLSWPLAKAVAQ